MDKQVETREEVVARLVAGQSAVSRLQAAVIGVPWPLEKGWRKTFLDSIGHKSFREIEAKTYARDMGIVEDKNGKYLVRVTGSGKAHIMVNGSAICRQKVRDGKYVLTAVKPEAVPVCKTCAQLQKTDPHNRRIPGNKPSAEFYSSWEWKKARYETFKRYGKVCMCCGSIWNIVVDHIKPRRFYPDLELDLNNLQVLCNDCNQGKSYDDQTDFRPK